jgi:hypothetical protein
MVGKSALLVGAIFIASSVYARDVSAEDDKAAHGSISIMAGQESSLFDATIVGGLGAGSGYYVRNKTNVDYDGDTSHLAIANAEYPLFPGLDVVIGGEVVPGMGFSGRTGFQGSVRKGDYSLLGLVTTNIGQALEGEVPDIEYLVSASYRPRLTERLDLVLRVKDVTNFKGRDHNYSAQEIRAGFGVKDYVLGVGSDLLQIGKDFTFSYTGGVFLSRQF